MYRGPVCEILISVVLRLDMTIFTYRSAPRAPRAVAAPRPRPVANERRREGLGLEGPARASSAAAALTHEATSRYSRCCLWHLRQ